MFSCVFWFACAHDLLRFDQDERLAAGIDKFTSKDWNSVVDHMGRGLTAMQCKRRWYLHLRSMRDNQVVDRKWTESEVSALKGSTFLFWLLTCINTIFSGFPIARADQ